MATAGTYCITFGGTQPYSSGNDRTTFIDDVQIQPDLVTNGDFESVSSSVSSDAYTASFG